MGANYTCTLVYRDGYTESLSLPTQWDAQWHARNHVLVGGGQPITGYTRTAQGRTATVYTAHDGRRAATVVAPG